MKRYDISLVAEGLATYAIERQSSFERWQPPDKPPWAESRRFWADAILQGMVRLEGGVPGPELMERFDQRLEAARGCAVTETLSLAAQKELVRNLRNYVTALEDAGGDRRRQVSVVKELLEDMATHLSWDSSANGVGLARGEAEGALLRMTARLPICFTRVLLGAEVGPGGEDFVSGSVTDADSVRATELFAKLTQEHPEVAEWPAICTVYFVGGPAALATRPADALDLDIIRGERVRFLDRPEISLAGSHELRVPVHEPIRVLKFEPGEPPEEITLPNTLDALQAAVGGYIEAVGLDCGICLICNEEGKLAGLPANRRVNDDTIAGTFLIVGEADGEFCSLTDEDAAYYLEQFAEPLPQYGGPDEPTQWEFHVF